MRPPAKQPCGQCPFRKASTRGYLGADNPGHFIMTALSPVVMPCHLTVDYTNPGWKDEAVHSARQCSGRAIFLANNLKNVRNPEIRELPRDRERVFSWPHEFVEHHMPKATLRGVLEALRAIFGPLMNYAAVAQQLKAMRKARRAAGAR